MSQVDGGLVFFFHTLQERRHIYKRARALARSGVRGNGCSGKETKCVMIYCQ